MHGALELGDVSHKLTLGLNYSTFSRDQSLSVCANNFAFDPRISEVDTLPNVRLDPDDQFSFVAAIFSGRLTLNSSITGELSDEERVTVSALGPYLQQQGLRLLSERCGVSDQDLDEDRIEFNAIAVSEFSDNVQNSFGISLTHNDIEAQTYLNGTVRQNAYQVYNNLRFRPSDRWVLNGMLSLEGADNVDADTAFSYRFSANYRATDAIVLRVMHARAERLPDVYETSRDWTYLTVYDGGEVDHLGRDRGSLLRRAMSPDNLQPEVLQNTEIALSYNVFNNVQADIKVFHEDYSDLISEAFNYIDFRLTNTGELKNQGIEFGIQHTLSSGVRWGSSYTYLDADTDTTFEDSLRPTHSGSLWTIVPVGENTHLAAAYYGASDVAQGSYDRFDFTATHSVRIGRTDIDLQLNYRHYPEGINAFTEISSITPNVALVDDEHRVFLTLRASFF
jgi:outer membrane receptor protein involved in Fe transport